MNMLTKHFENMEEVLLVRLKQSKSLGHPVDKGTVSEIFIKDFLRDHLGENIGIGSGEIIDANSKPNEKRHQHDVIIYRKDYPKLHFAHGIDTFIAESVVATIEVKSTLDKHGLRQAIQSAHQVKALKREFASMWTASISPPHIRSYVFAYQCSKPISKVVGAWFKNIHQELHIAPPKMSESRDERLEIPSPALDGIVVLRKGFLHMNNITLMPKEHIDSNSNATFFTNDNSAYTLLILFLWLTDAIDKVAFSVWGYGSYLPKE
jgi:hypothetical protein